MKIDYKKLDQLLRKNTSQESKYLNGESERSPIYAELEKKKINNEEMYIFNLPDLGEKEIQIRKDSRYTSVPDYIHSNINMNYIYSGTVEYVIDGKHIKLSSGDVCVFDKDVIRSKAKTGKDDIVINISMKNDFFSNRLINTLKKKSIVTSFIFSTLTNESHDNYLIFSTNRNKKIHKLFMDLLIEYYDENIYSKEAIQSLLSLIFIELLREHQNKTGKYAIKISSHEGNTILDILLYIETNYLNCTLKKLAYHFDYHPKYLSILIKEKTGKNFKQIQTDKKMQVARDYLLNTDLSNQRIAEEINISNINYFYKKFKETYNMSPKEFRQRK